MIKIWNFEKREFGKGISDSTIFVTVRDGIESGNITQVEINICDKESEDYRQFNFHIYLDENDQILNWEFLEEYLPYNAKECVVCFPFQPN